MYVCNWEVCMYTELMTLAIVLEEILLFQGGFSLEEYG